MSDINNFSNEALLVHIDKFPIEVNNSKEEFKDLVRSANIECVDTIYLTQKTDSLEQQIALNNKFYESIEGVLSGKTDDFISKESIQVDTSYSFDINTIIPNIQDSILRNYMLPSY